MGGCEQRIEVIVCENEKKVRMVGGSRGWSGGGDQSVCVNEGLKGCRSGVGSGWL